MALSPLEATATMRQLNAADSVEQMASWHVRERREPFVLPETGHMTNLGLVTPDDGDVALRITAERFRRKGWKVTVDSESRVLRFYDATPEF